MSILAGIVLASCTSGKKALERGDYYNATLQAVNRLRMSPDNKKAITALKDSYPMALEYCQRKADEAIRSNSPFKYSEAVDYYERMNEMAEQISRSPAAYKLFPEAYFYTDELTRARELAAGEHYAAALANEELNTRESWKQAYFQYQQADCYVPDYKDIRQRMMTAKNNATLKVIVEQIPVPGNYQLTSDFFLNSVIEDLENNRPNEFVEYYSPESAERLNILYPDQVLKMNFDEFLIGQVYDKESTVEFIRDSVDIGTVTLKDGTKQTVFGTVKAKMTTYRREILSSGVLNLTILDFQSDKVLIQRKFAGQYLWFTEWSTFNGDERALTDQQLALCERKPMPNPPPQSLFVECTRVIYDQITPNLRSFYLKY
jgi:hypothetical protein